MPRPSIDGLELPTTLTTRFDYAGPTRIAIAGTEPTSARLSNLDFSEISLEVVATFILWVLSWLGPGLKLAMEGLPAKLIGLLTEPFGFISLNVIWLLDSPPILRGLVKPYTGLRTTWLELRKLEVGCETLATTG